MEHVYIVNQDYIDNNLREKYKVDCGHSLTLEDIGITDNVNNRYVKRESNHIKFDNVISLYNNNLCITNYNLVQIYNTKCNEYEILELEDIGRIAEIKNCDIDRMRIFYSKLSTAVIRNCTMRYLIISQDIITSLYIENCVIDNLYVIESNINRGLYISYNSEIKNIRVTDSLINNNNIITVNYDRMYNRINPIDYDQLYEEVLQDAAQEKISINNSCIINGNISESDAINLSDDIKKEYSINKLITDKDDNSIENAKIICGYYHNDKKQKGED